MSYENLERLPDPNTNPAGPGFITQRFIDNTPGMIHDLNSGASISVSFAGNYWTLDIAYPELTIPEGNSLLPFLYGLQGPFSNFYVQLADKANPRTGAWVTDTNTDIAKGEMTLESSRVVRVPEWSTRGGELSPGDLIKFDGSNKIYMVVSVTMDGADALIRLNCEFIGSGTQLGTMGLEPNDIKIRVRIKDRFTPPELTANGLYSGFSLSLKENIL